MKYAINFTAAIETFVWEIKQVWYYYSNYPFNALNSDIMHS